MPRQRRENEEYLESIEPVGVVVLNDVSYLLQDLSEIVLDLAKLLRNRREEVMDFVTRLPGGPDALAELLPEEFLPFLMGSAGEVAGVSMELRGDIAPDPSDEAPASGPFAAVDIDKIQPDMLEKVGAMIREKAEGLEELIAAFEAKLIEEHPPS